MSEIRSRKKEVTHRIMSSIPSKNTRPEMLLRKELHSRGLRYRINYKAVPGKPDVAFTKARLAVFVDGDLQAAETLYWLPEWCIPIGVEKKRLS